MREPPQIPSGVSTHLPAEYVRALQGVLAGLSDAELADVVGVDPAAVPALVRIMTVKLVEIVAERDRPAGQTNA